MLSSIMATSGSVIYYEIVLAEERALDAAKFVEAAARVPNPELLDKCRKAVAERDYAAVISEILDVGQGVLFRNSSDEGALMKRPTMLPHDSEL